MATGAGFSGIMTAVLPLLGLVTLWTARRGRRRRDGTSEDAEIARRQAERAETERRMASYLAQRSSALRPADDEVNEQEIRR